MSGGSAPDAGAPARRMLTAFIPSLRLQAQARRDPSLVSRPLALESREASARGCILEVSRAAREQGVEPGLTRARARAACPELILVSMSEREEAEARAEIVESLAALLARVEWAGGGVFHADARAVTRLHGSEASLLVRCAQELQSLGYLARVACASTRLASLLAARTRPGLSLIREGGERELLDPLPLTLLPLPADALARFDLLGVRTLGALARLPEHGLADRFGREVARLRRLVRGEEAEPIVALPETRVPQALIELDEPVSGHEPVLFLLKSCCERLAEELEQRQLAAARIEVRLAGEGGEGESETRLLEPARPLASARDLLTLCRSEIEARPVRAASRGICAIVLAARQTSPCTPHAPRLGQRVDRAALGAALDRLRALLGSERVVRPEPRPAHRREARQQWAAFDLEKALDSPGPAPARRDCIPAPARRDCIPAPARRENDEHGLPLATRLLPRPLPAIVRLPEDGPGLLSCTSAPRLGLGLPERAEIAFASGPIRITGEWWESGADVDRDEYVLHARDGGAYLVARDRRTRRWSLMGWLD